MSNCRKCKKKVFLKPIMIESTDEKEPQQIQLPEKDSAELRRTMIGKTIRIRFRPPEPL